MKVSVVIPCHNAGRWIGETLRSVAAQTRPVHEVIVVDDASTDDSVEQIQKTGLQVKLLRVECRNAAAARNAGIEAATGNWIALLDADDIWYSNHLERAEQVLSGTKDVAYRALCDDMTAEGVMLPATLPQPLPETRTGISHQQYMRFEDQDLYFGHSSFLYLRDRVMEVGGFDKAQVRRHDIDLWLRVIHGRTWAWDVVPTVAYRCDTPGSISSHYIDCEFYYLRALLRNREAYRGQDMESRLEKIARRVMTLGFTDGTPEQWRAARELAWNYLPGSVRVAYTMAGWSPSLARRFIRLKRNLRSWRTGSRLPDLCSVSTPTPVGEC